MKNYAIIACNLALAVASGHGGGWRRDGLPVAAVVQRVVDGDTVRVRLDGRSVAVRIRGIDAPETGQARCGDEKRRGLEAKARLAELLPVGAPVELDHLGPDKYRRTVARVTLATDAGRMDAGAVLLAEGLARAYDGGRRRPWCF